MTFKIKKKIPSGKKKRVGVTQEENKLFSWKQAATCQNDPWKSPHCCVHCVYAVIKNGLKRTRA